MASSSSDIKATEVATNPVEALVRDATESQLEQGFLPQPGDIADFVRPIVERLERTPKTGAETKTEKRPDGVRKEFERRGGEGFDDFDVIRGRDSAPQPMAGAPVSMPAENLEGLRARLRLLKLNPEWRKRLVPSSSLTMAAQLNDAQGKKDLARQQFMQAKELLSVVLDDSVRKFGPWWPVDSKVTVHG